jgi:hypothetical protein
VLYIKYLELLALLEVIYCLIVVTARLGHYPQVPPQIYPQLPPLAITIFLFGNLRNVVGAVVHGALFTGLNLPLLDPNLKVRPAFPLSVASVLACLLAYFWPKSVKYGLRYQGRAYVMTFAVVNGVAVVVLVLLAVWLYQTQAKAGGQTWSDNLLWFNFSTYVALMLVFFPYFGEVP